MPLPDDVLISSALTFAAVRGKSTDERLDALKELLDHAYDAGVAAGKGGLRERCVRGGPPACEDQAFPSAPPAYGGVEERGEIDGD